MSFKLTLGKTAFAGTDLFTNEAICGLVPIDKHDDTILEYLYHILPMLDYAPYAQRAAKGLTLNKELIPTVEIPFPEKEQRKQIIENLNRLNKELADKKQEYEKAMDVRTEYMESLITEE